MVDDRVLSVNYRKYEDETYQRLRYELGHILHDKQEIIIEINDLIQRQNQTINTKRQQLTQILSNLLTQLVT